MITALYASILGLFFIFLAFKTIKLRRKHLVGIGDGDHDELARAARVHANFAEYIPLALMLVFFVEHQSGASLLVHGLLSGLGDRPRAACPWGE